MARPADDAWQRFGYVLGALPGVILHLFGSMAAWILVQLNGLAVAGCPSRTCNDAVIFLALNGVQLVLIVAWVVTTVLVFVRSCLWGRNPWPVLGVGVSISFLITASAYVAFQAGAGLLRNLAGVIAVV